MTLEDSAKERAKESFGFFADRVREHHDNPYCNRRLYPENIACYQKNLTNWVTRFTGLEIMDDCDVYETITATHALIAEMLSDPTKFSAPSREPIAQPAAPPAPR